HVRITLADSFEIPADADYKFEISQNIKNEEGETLVADKTDAEEGNPSNWNTNIGLLDNIAPELEGAIYAVESSNAKQTEKIKLTFSEAVTSTTGFEDNLEVVVNGEEQTVTAFNPINDGDEVLITLDKPVNVNQGATITVVEDE